MNHKGTLTRPLSTYTKLIVYFIIRLIGRMPFAPTQTKIGRMPFAPTEEIQPAQAGFVCADRGFNRPVFKPKIPPAQAGFVCADRGFNRPVKLIRLYRWLSKINTKTYN
jgi:hypothetical protein